MITANAHVLIPVLEELNQLLIQDAAVMWLHVSMEAYLQHMTTASAHVLILVPEELNQLLIQDVAVTL